MASSTSKRQRIFILLIAAVMVVGTLGSFAVLVLATQEDQQTASRQQEAQQEIELLQSEYQAKIDAQGRELSERYYDKFSKYGDRPAEFAIDSVDELKTQDLEKGSSTTIDENTPFGTYYIGWNPDGVVFDGSLEGSSLKPPFVIDSGLAQASVIEGWKQGIKGMKIGGVRLLEIPSDLAYGEQGSGDTIPPNTPIKFVVMTIEKPETIAFPDIPDSLLEEAYGSEQF